MFYIENINRKKKDFLIKKFASLACICMNINVCVCLALLVLCIHYIYLYLSMYILAVYSALSTGLTSTELQGNDLSVFLDIYLSLALRLSLL